MKVAGMGLRYMDILYTGSAAALSPLVRDPKNMGDFAVQYLGEVSQIES